MYILLFRDKQLYITKKTGHIYQYDNRVDKLIFLIKPLYDDIDISHYTILMRIETENNDMGSGMNSTALPYCRLDGTENDNTTKHTIELPLNEDLYKGYLVSDYVITNEITQNTGTISIGLYLTCTNEEDNKTYVMNSNVVHIPILPSCDMGKDIDKEDNPSKWVKTDEVGNLLYAEDLDELGVTLVDGNL